MAELACGRQETCGSCLDISEKGRTIVCSAVGVIPVVAEGLGLLGPEDMSYEEFHDITYTHMTANVGIENVDPEMREAAPEAAVELFHVKKG